NVIVGRNLARFAVRLGGDRRNPAAGSVERLHDSSGLQVDAMLLQISNPRRDPYIARRSIQEPVEPSRCQQSEQQLQQGIPDRASASFLGANGDERSGQT